MRVDTIHLRGLSAYGTHGVLDFEHREPQEFVVDVSYSVVTERAVVTDDISHTISYADIAAAVVQRITGEHVDLIETLADRIANDVLEFGAREVDVTVHKPQAPIEQTFADVCVQAHRQAAILSGGRRKYVIALGSNLDNPRQHVSEAIEQLSELFSEMTVSDLFTTAPVLHPGQAEQPDYVNAVLIGYSAAAPIAVLHALQEIEWKHGRERLEHWGARTLDLDIIAIEGVTSSDVELTVPHPRAALRRFVLEPWLSIEPDAELSGVALTQLVGSAQ
ncbi:2-amino-4-hydroxy-6-hydroxymethyldihydropteridine diphosphokinase [Arcanobacterium bovis]|uniref:Bifunctional folate synthesis protein n=1 Tax=Arcanobacterium bovis TaxID=2529275 RepID=A0A4V2KR20_9ACTO|nr:2-amino-4-hydroxy-6-hydroxymethyldihydropteridine diphosphokinase [Arcanobacterium bovis]TBW21488.1 2-amino-4-hydroxy-6-hydroxymethyldihydropteridine diphosphokinase [Arcanobacterium bovis]